MVDKLNERKGGSSRTDSQMVSVDTLVQRSGNLIKHVKKGG